MSHEGIRFTTPEQREREERESQPLPRAAVTPKKVRVHISEGTEMEIDWADGHHSSWSFAFLRDACPCATCLGERSAEGRKPGQPKPKPTALLPMYTPPPKPSSAQGVGHYAIRFNWLDGHSGGIYSWEYLRRICPCGECTFERTPATGTPN